MSQLWRDQTHVFCAPERIDLVRFSRGLKPVQTQKMTAQCIRDKDLSLWASSLHQLEQMMSTATDTEMVVTLSNHFIRYVVLPPQSEITTPDEVHAYAAFRMQETYGANVDAWVLSISDWDPTGGAVCAAINRDLIAQLDTMVTHFKVKLKGVEPYLASVFDRWLPQITEERIYFALVETGRFCIAVLINGIWHNIRNQRILHSMPDELLAALEQEAVLSGHKAHTEQVYLFAPEHPELILPPDCGWYIVPLQTKQLPVLAHYPTPGSHSSNHEEGDTCVA